MNDSASVSSTIEVVEPESWGGFTSEVETATDVDVSAAIEELHRALMVAEQPALPRVTFVKAPRRPVLDLDDEITNVVHR